MKPVLLTALLLGLGLSVAQAPRSATLLRLGSDTASATVVGSFDGRWRQADGQVYARDNMKELEGPVGIANRSFTVYGLLGAVGRGQSGAQATAPTDVCGWNRVTPFSARLSGPTPRPLYALNAPWNPQPRPVGAITPTTAHLQTVASEARKLGLTAAPGLKDIQQALRVDLDGDGRLEVILTANNPNYAVGGDAATGQYAQQPGHYGMVVVRKLLSDTQLRTFVLRSGLYSARDAEQSPLMYQFRVGAILDLDGDGRMEVIVDDWVHEGIGATVWRWQDGRFVKVLDWGCGV